MSLTWESKNVFSVTHTHTKKIEQVDCQQEGRCPQRKVTREIRRTVCAETRKLRDMTKSKDLSVQLKTSECRSCSTQNSLGTAQITETCHLNVLKLNFSQISEITNSIILSCTYFKGMLHTFIKTSKMSRGLLLCAREEKQHKALSVQMISSVSFFSLFIFLEAKENGSLSIGKRLNVVSYQ